MKKTKPLGGKKIASRIFLGICLLAGGLVISSIIFVTFQVFIGDGILRDRSETEGKAQLTQVPEAKFVGERKLDEIYLMVIKVRDIDLRVRFVSSYFSDTPHVAIAGITDSDATDTCKGYAAQGTFDAGFGDKDSLFYKKFGIEYNSLADIVAQLPQIIDKVKTLPVVHPGTFYNYDTILYNCESRSLK